MFTPEESQFILNAINEEVKRTGLQTAGFALGIVAKMQAGLAAQDKAAAEESGTEGQPTEEEPQA